MSLMTGPELRYSPACLLHSYYLLLHNVPNAVEMMTFHSHLGLNTQLSRFLNILTVIESLH